MLLLRRLFVQPAECAWFPARAATFGQSVLRDGPGRSRRNEIQTGSKRSAPSSGWRSPASPNCRPVILAARAPSEDDDSSFSSDDKGSRSHRVHHESRSYGGGGGRHYYRSSGGPPNIFGAVMRPLFGQ